ncbi:MAG: cytochrome b/b6 domain-containing protein [Bdellovibrionales bacterium]|nr:cytochrome b/b6 domain-containing protein [Bdellovibrionales bacterium]
MKSIRVYDLPTRVFHWLFALSFVVAFTIGNTVDDDSALFSYHMIAGIVLCCLVVFRVVWGIFGTEFARFSRFSLNPKSLSAYFSGILKGEPRKWAGHNPASSWAALAMMACALGLGITGYLMSTGYGGEDLEEVHELLANGFLVIVFLHVGGVILHTVRHKDSIWKSMISGRKLGLSENVRPVSANSVVGIMLFITTVGLYSYLIQEFNPRTRTLTLFGTKFHLGENEEHEHREHGTSKKRSSDSKKRKQL